MPVVADFSARRQHRRNVKSNSERAVFGIYGKLEAVGTVVDRLLSEGFSPSAISVLLQNREDARRLTQATKTGAAETAVESSRSAIADRGFALFAGLAELDVPDAGMFLAAGRIMIILAGGTAGETMGQPGWGSDRHGSP